MFQGVTIDWRVIGAFKKDADHIIADKFDLSRLELKTRNRFAVQGDLCLQGSCRIQYFYSRGAEGNAVS